MKMNRDEAYKLNKVLNELDAKKYSKYFLLAISDAKRNLKVIVDEIENKVKGLSFPEQQDLMNKRLEIIRKYAIKDDFGNVKLNGERIEFEDGKEKICQDEIDELFRNNPSVLESANRLNREFENFLLEQIELEFFKVKFEYFPSDIDEVTYNTLEIFRKETIQEILG